MLRLSWVIVFIAISVTNLGAQQYDVRLFFPAKPGEKYRISTTVSHGQRLRTFIDGNDMGEKTENLIVEFIATITELEVNEKGRATKRQMTIENCVINAGGEKKTLPSGLQVLAFEQNKKKVFEIDGVTAEPLISRALQLALPLNPDTPTDDEAFGTREKKSVGDSWQINGGLVAQWLQQLYGVVASQVSGTMKLNDVVEGPQTKYLAISGGFAISDFTMPLPRDFKVQSGRFKATLSGRYPISQRYQQASETTEWLGEFVANGPAPATNEKEMTIKGSLERRRTVQFEEIN